MTACQTTETTQPSHTEGSPIPETEGGFRAPAEPSPAPADTMTKPSAKLELRPVYFGFDRFDLTPEARASLRQDAMLLKKASGATTLAGHTDERGTFEYNLALGVRRANTVKNYLVALGVSASSLRTKSYGEANAAVKGHDESAWRWNRRVALAR